MSKGVISRGISTQIIKEGDDLVKIVVDSVIDEVKKSVTIPEPIYIDGLRTFTPKEIVTYDLNDKDVIGITESVIARAAGQYVTVDDIATVKEFLVIFIIHLIQNIVLGLVNLNNINTPTTI